MRQSLESRIQRYKTNDYKKIEILPLQKGAAAMLARLVKEKKLTDENFKVGLTKVFFKAGIVAHLEDIRYKLKSYLL